MNKLKIDNKQTDACSATREGIWSSNVLVTLDSYCCIIQEQQERKRKTKEK